MNMNDLGDGKTSQDERNEYAAGKAGPRLQAQARTSLD